jgi:protein-tyrosine phosphatase
MPWGESIDAPRTMVDLHCHILPNVDDGAASLEESLWMARFYVAEGTRHVVATPHCYHDRPLMRSAIVPAVSALVVELAAAEIPLTVLPGSEIQIVDSTQFRREFDEGPYCHLGGGRRFTLVEFSWKRERVPADTTQVIEWIVEHGMTPILAHPERHSYYRQEPELLRAIVEAGAWLQITADSLLGNNGAEPQAMSEVYLREFRDVVLASDAHNRERCSGLAPGFAWVVQKLGAARADELRARGEWILARLQESKSE